jgi:hypothetical protein
MGLVDVVAALLLLVGASFVLLAALDVARSYRIAVGSVIRFVKRQGRPPNARAISVAVLGFSRSKPQEFRRLQGLTSDYSVVDRCRLAC